MSLNMQDVRDALRNDWFIPFFQPVHDTAGNECVGAEVLARLSHPLLGVLPPSEFLPHMHDQQDLAALTRALMAESCQRFAGQALPAGFMLTFNVTIDMLKQSWLHASCEALSSALGGRVTIILEILEHTSFEELRQQLLSSVSLLRRKGVRLALDDFGTGYSGLALLHQVGGDYLKIPREFIAAMTREKTADYIIDNIVHLADIMQLGVIAEGVECQTQVSALSEKGVTLVQGFCYSPPIDGDEFITYLRKTGSAQTSEDVTVSTITKHMTPELLLRCAHLHRLSPREMEVITLIALGKKLTVSSKNSVRNVKTMSVQKRSAYKKIGVTNDVEFIHYLYCLTDNAKVA